MDGMVGSMRWYVTSWAVTLALVGCSNSSGDATPSGDGSDSGTTGPAVATDGPAGSTDTSATTTPGEDTTGGGSTDTGTPSTEGCDGAPLLPVPADPAAPGPWPVGVRTVDLDGLTVEVWYPATPGSERGETSERYDIRLQLPPDEADKISDEDNPWQPCDCFRDLPIDDGHGPYPAVFFIHGTASFRTQSVEQMTHWASRGFVVLAADHPGLKLGDLLGMVCGAPAVAQDLAGNVQTMMEAARGRAPGLEAIAGSIDATRFGVSGHSAGGNATAQFGDEAQVLMPLAAGGVMPGTAVVSTLVMGAQQDSVVSYDTQVSGYEASPSPKRLVGIDNQGHLAFSGLCDLRNAAGEDLLEVAANAGVCGANLAGVLFQCSDAFLDTAETIAIVNFATAATLEETLHCSPIGGAFAGLVEAHPAVAELRSDPPA
jgi:fermentation-respiration switch protein FrsA (DUF1100 family)